MASPFDRAPERRGTDSVKWGRSAGRDVLPLWVADMDFAVAPAIEDVLQRRVAHGVFGYAAPWPSLEEAAPALEVLTPRERRSVLRGEAALLLDRLLVRVARGRTALDVAICEGLGARSVGGRLLRLGWSQHVRHRSQHVRHRSPPPIPDPGTDPPGDGTARFHFTARGHPRRGEASRPLPGPARTHSITMKRYGGRSRASGRPRRWEAAMWRVLMALVAGAFLVQVDFDTSVERSSAGTGATICADEALSAEAYSSGEEQSVFGGCKCGQCAKGYVCRLGGRCCGDSMGLCCCCQPK